MRIKFLSKTPLERMAPLWEALIPDGGFPGAEFTFNPDDRNYDALVIYEDLPPLPGESKIFRAEPLACPRERTMLITTEPSSIRISGYNYLRQYGTVWTSVQYPQRKKPYRKGDPSWELTTPPLRWFYGRDLEGNDHWPLERIKQSPVKTADLSTVCSNKAMAHTVHGQRLEFVKALKARIGDDLALFGRGFDPVDDKAQAMAPYRYHIAIENHRQNGHITEKLTDCFLAECLPFYFGAPNYDDDFPKDSVIPIDIYDLAGTEAIIRNAIANNEHAKRRDALREAKAVTLDMFNPLRGAIRFAEGSKDEGDPPKPSDVIHGRHAFRRAHPLLAARDAIEVARLRRSKLADSLQ